MDHSGGMKVSLGGSQESVMRETGGHQEGALVGGEGCQFSCWFALEGRALIYLSVSSVAFSMGVGHTHCGEHSAGKD